MLSQADNESMTQTGPGSPGGAFLRRFWHPVLLADELEPGGAPRRAAARRKLGRVPRARRTARLIGRGLPPPPRQLGAGKERRLRAALSLSRLENRRRGHGGRGALGAGRRGLRRQVARSPVSPARGRNRRLGLHRFGRAAARSAICVHRPAVSPDPDYARAGALQLGAGGRRLSRLIAHLASARLRAVGACVLCDEDGRRGTDVRGRDHAVRIVRIGHAAHRRGPALHACDRTDTPRRRLHSGRARPR